MKTIIVCIPNGAHFCQNLTELLESKKIQYSVIHVETIEGLFLELSEENEDQQFPFVILSETALAQVDLNQDFFPKVREKNNNLEMILLLIEKTSISNESYFNKVLVVEEGINIMFQVLDYIEKRLKTRA